MYKDDDYKNLRKRTIAFIVAIAILFAIFGGFLLKYQVIDSKGKPKAVSAYETIVSPLRGDILDRNGNYLATSVQVNTLIFNAQKFPSRKEFLEERERRRAQRYKK